MPRATLDTTSATNAGVWTRPMGSSMHGSPSSGTKVRSAGTRTSSTLKWWLAVAHMPVAVHVGSMTISSGVNSAARSIGWPSTRPWTALP